MAAARLPGKPLADIAGEPMIVHVLRRAQEAAVGPVVVATDSAEVAAVVDKAGGRAVMTRADHASGSDRIFEALGKVDPQGSAGIIVNLQGDLPTLSPSAIAAAHCAACRCRRRYRHARRRNHGSPTSGPIPTSSRSWARRLRAERLRALYFTRATAPAGDGPLYHHIGLYAYRRAALERFVALPPSPLERREKLEQLRALEAGMRIDVAIVDAVPLGVDTPEDLEKARAVLTGRINGKTHARIAFQGEPGANSHIACKEAYPGYEPLPCPTFEDAFAAVRTGRAALAMIPIDNSVAGRVADIHHLMPASRLHIVAEWFLPVQHQLMAAKGATLRTIKTVESHVHALGQCRNIIRKLRVKAVVAADTAGAAREVAEAGDVTRAALATKLAAKIYGLRILKKDVADAKHNTTRFVVLAREPKWASRKEKRVMTTFVFQVRNIPAALYKALGGFATNGVNMTKLESYMVDGSFTATQFYADVEGHPKHRALELALEELEFVSLPKSLRILGVYPAHRFRETIK